MRRDPGLALSAVLPDPIHQHRQGRVHQHPLGFAAKQQPRQAMVVQGTPACSAKTRARASTATL
jgi:hypothetical protein